MQNRENTGELFGIENLLQYEKGGSILQKLRAKYATSENNQNDTMKLSKRKFSTDVDTVNVSTAEKEDEVSALDLQEAATLIDKVSKQTEINDITSSNNYISDDNIDGWSLLAAIGAKNAHLNSEFMTQRSQTRQKSSPVTPTKDHHSTSTIKSIESILSAGSKPRKKSIIDVPSNIQREDIVQSNGDKTTTDILAVSSDEIPVDKNQRKRILPQEFALADRKRAKKGDDKKQNLHLYKPLY